METNQQLIVERKLIHFVEKSNNSIQRQFESIDCMAKKAQSFLFILSITIPLLTTFLFQLDRILLKILGSAIMGMSITSLIYFVCVINKVSIYAGYAVDKTKKIINKEYDEILKTEINANIRSFKKNEVIINKKGKYFECGVFCLSIELILFIVLLIVKFFIN